MTPYTVQDLRDKLVVARSHVQSVLVQLDTETDPRALAQLLARADHLNAAGKYRVLPPYRRTFVTFRPDSSPDSFGTVHRSRDYSAIRDPVRIIGSKGDDPGQFRFPRHMAILHDGNLVVADRRNNRVQILTPEGHCVRIINLRKSPEQVAVAGNGAIWILLRSFIAIYWPSGELLREFRVDVSDGDYLRTLPNGDVLVTNMELMQEDGTFADRVYLMHVFQPDGKFLWHSALSTEEDTSTMLREPFDGTVVDNEILIGKAIKPCTIVAYEIDPNNLRRCIRDDDKSNSFQGIQFLESLSFDPIGRVLIAKTVRFDDVDDVEGIAVWTLDGLLVHQRERIGPAEFGQFSCCVAPDNTIYCIDYHQHCIRVY